MRPKTTSRPASPAAILRMVAATLAGVMAACLGHGLAAPPAFVSPVWPATGFAIWWILVAGRRSWPVIAVATVAGALIWRGGGSVAGLATFAAGATLEGLAGARIWRWIQQRLGTAGGLADAISAIVMAPLAAAVGASCGLAALAVEGLLVPEEGLQTWLAWWAGNVLGAMVVVPFLLAGPAMVQAWRRINAGQAGRILGVGAATLAVFWYAFAVHQGGMVILAVFPVLLLGAAWLGNAGVRLLAMTVLVAVGVGTHLEAGPFVDRVGQMEVAELQVFFAMVSLTSLVLPALGTGRRLVLPGSILLGGWVLCAWIFVTLDREARRRSDSLFDGRIAAAQTGIEVRFANYIHALQGGVALFAADDAVSRKKWQVYTAALQLEKNYPGINGLGVIYPVAPERAGEWLAQARADGLEVGEIRPFPATTGSPDQMKFVITYCEPAGRNRVSVGRNIATEESRRVAAELARDTGEPQINRRIRGSRDSQRRPGFLLYLPLYRSGAKLETVAQRRAAHYGWVYAQFFTDNFLKGVLGPLGEKLEVHIFEVGGLEREFLLYSSQGDQAGPLPRFSRMTQLELAGQRFQLGWNRGRGFAGPEKMPVLLTAVGFNLTALLLAGLVASQQSSRLRAEQLVQERTVELERAQAELVSTVQLQQAILDGSQYSIISTTPTGLIVTFNAGAEKMLGWRSAELVGIRSLELLHAAEEVEPRAVELSRELGQPVAPGFEVVVARARRGESEEREWTYVRRDGTRLPVMLSVTALRSAQAEVTGFLGIARDITWQKEAELALRATLREVGELRAALDAHALVIVTDLDGQITHVNARFCEFSKYSPGELIGQRPRLVNSGLHSKEFFAEMWTTIARGEVWRGELRNRAKDGTEYWVASAVVPSLDEQGRPARYVGIQIDLTERKRLEESLARARDQALEASRMKSEFMATISHEIRTPMNAVLGMAELLSDTPLTEDQAEMLATLCSGAETLLTLINDILDFSRIEAGRLRLEPADFDFRRVIEEVVALLSPQAQAKHLELTCEIGTAPAWLLLGDAGRVRQVATNLIGNAIKFTEHGEVAVAVAAGRAGVDGSRQRVRVTVRDTGVGISKASQAKLFQPFVQGDGSTTRRFGGSGLGLAISRQLVELMGGQIGFESEAGRGSTFWFEVDFTRQAAAPAPEPDLPGTLPRLGGLRILVAEDNLANQRVATLLLKKLGHIPEIATNGSEVLAKLAAKEFDAVLMDCQMPILDGYEASRRIRARALPGINARIPIIALTAYARPEDRAKCLAAGMDEYVSKPLRGRELQEALQRCGFGPAPESPPPGAAGPSSAVFDLEALETTRGLPGRNRASLLQELVAAYLESEPRRREQMARLAAEKQGAELAELAHAFGGEAAAFGGTWVRKVALDLEDAARRQEWAEVDVVRRALEVACLRLRGEIDRLKLAGH